MPRSLTLVACALVAALLAPSIGAAKPAAKAPYDVDVIEPGVLLFRPTDGDPRRANSLVVEQRRGLLVVDAQPTASAARELVAAVRARTGRAPRYLVLSHPHAEAAGGVAGFPDDVVVIASDACAAALADPAYDFGAEARARSSDPEHWVEPPRPTPELVLHGAVVFDDPDRPVVVAPHLHAHSIGDTLISLERLQIAYVGGLVVDDRNPYAKGADIGGWLATLNGLARESPRFVVGTRGPAQTMDRVRKLRDALAWMRGQVEYAFTEHVTLEDIPTRVLATPGIAEHFDLSASPAFVRLLIEQVLAESVEHRRKRGEID